jgi:molybdopterin-binding protein
MPATRVYSAGDAARALGISLDTLRRWDREGRIRVKRDSANRRVVTEAEIARLRGRDQHSLSARNHLRGVVESVQVEGLLARVELVVDKPARVVAIITAEAAAELGLQKGSPAAAVVKSTSIMVER